LYKWLQSLISGEKTICVKDFGKVLAKHRLAMIEDLMIENNLVITVHLVKLEENKADALTRVPQSWLVKAFVLVVFFGRKMLQELQDVHQYGIENNVVSCTSLFF